MINTARLLQSHTSPSTGLVIELSQGEVAVPAGEVVYVRSTDITGYSNCNVSLLCTGSFDSIKILSSTFDSSSVANEVATMTIANGGASKDVQIFGRFCIVKIDATNSAGGVVRDIQMTAKR